MVAWRRLQKCHLIGQNHDFVANRAAGTCRRTPKTSRRRWARCESQVIILFSGVWILQAMSSAMD